MAVFSTRSTAYRDVSQCAVVLEGDPAGQDARLDFESFPQEIEESYATAAYKEHGAFKVPQPSGASYMGGNWGTISLNLVFRADAKSRRLRPGQNITTSQVEGVLVELERKVRWLQALAFPLERKASAITNRILKRSANFGNTPLAGLSKGLAGLTRTDPPFVLVVYGSFLIIRGYVTNVTVKWVGPWHPVSVRPFGAEVSLTIQRLEKGLLTFGRIRNQAGSLRQNADAAELRGIVSIQDQQNFNDQATVAVVRESAILSDDPTIFDL